MFHLQAPPFAPHDPTDDAAGLQDCAHAVPAIVKPPVEASSCRFGGVGRCIALAMASNFVLVLALDFVKVLSITLFSYVAWSGDVKSFAFTLVSMAHPKIRHAMTKFFVWMDCFCAPFVLYPRFASVTGAHGAWHARIDCGRLDLVRLTCAWVSAVATGRGAVDELGRLRIT